jgi:hypothetical protein
MFKLLDLLKEEQKKSFDFPEGFQPAKVIPKGGIMCANCAKWNEEEQHCDGQYYIKWNGNGEIPATPKNYVCIWWVPKVKDKEEPVTDKK